MLKAGFEPELCYLSCFILSVTVFLLWRAYRVDGFIYIMKVEKGYPGERKHSVHTTLWVEGNKVQDWKWGCSASIPVMLKWGHCDFALLLVLCALNPTIHLQFNTAGLVGRKKELDNSVIRWTWKLVVCGFSFNSEAQAMWPNPLCFIKLLFALTWWMLQFRK